MKPPQNPSLEAVPVCLKVLNEFYEEFQRRLSEDYKESPIGHIAKRARLALKAYGYTDSPTHPPMTTKPPKLPESLKHDKDVVIDSETGQIVAMTFDHIAAAIVTRYNAHDALKSALESKKNHAIRMAKAILADGDWTHSYYSASEMEGLIAKVIGMDSLEDEHARQALTLAAERGEG